MTKHVKVWTSAGLTALGASVAAQAAVLVELQLAPPPMSILLVEDDGGEGGGEGGGDAVGSYALNSTDATAFAYDAGPQIDAYIDLVRQSYLRAAETALVLDTAVSALLADPSEETLTLAREAWMAARPAYMRTEAFRFVQGPIDVVEGQINAWPMNEAHIDYVAGNPSSGLINAKGSLAIADLIAGNQAKDDADVTTGWHAIEFLLWGQDLSASGPGARPASDFIAGVGNNDRRRDYLAAVSRQLNHDLRGLVDVWEAEGEGSYVAFLRGLPQREVIGRMVNGMAILAGYEFMSERLSVALDSGDQEDEQSCFSDTTRADFINDFEGIQQVWTGDADGVNRPGLDELVRALDPATADLVDAALADTKAKVTALTDPWDRTLAADAAGPERQAGEALVTSLGELAAALTKAGTQLGVLVLIPS